MPLCSIILMIGVTIARHEGWQAIFAWMHGVPLQAIRLLPGYDPA
jgi:hypothetical protein